jgi:ABC-type transport system involved in multi-copper enzyme maturation permease subunit
MDVNSLARSPGTIALSIAAGAYAFAFLTRRFWFWLFGPMFVVEVVRSSRRAEHFILRVVYGCILLLIISTLIPKSIAANANAVEWVSDLLSHAWLLAQALAVTILTPLYVARSVVDEKEKRSLDFVLCTPLSDREIVLGKLAARLIHVLGLLLVGLPILALTQLWGGVDFVHVLTGFATTAIAAVSLGSFSILCSVLARSSIVAVLSAYAIPLILFLVSACIPYGNLISPITMELTEFHGIDIFQSNSLSVPDRLIAFTLIHGLASVLCLRLAVLQLRTAAAPPEPIRDPLHDLIPPTDRDSVLFSLLQAPHVVTILPPVDEKRPLYWKEAHVGRTAETSMMFDVLWMCFGTLVFISGVIVLGYVHDDGFYHPYAATVTQIFRAYTILPSIILLLTVGYRLAGSITREREWRTLDSLLVLPGNRVAILRAKWLGAFRRAKRPLVALVATLVIATVCGATSVVSAGLVLMAVLANAVLVGTLGLFLSRVNRSTVFATMQLFVAVFATYALGLYLSVIAHIGHVFKLTWGKTIVSQVCEISTWDVFATNWDIWFVNEWKVNDIRMIEAHLIVNAIVVGAAAVLWFLTRWRFCRESA